MSKLLLVEDDQALAMATQAWLENERHAVDIVGNGREALEYVKSSAYDLIILDWELPELSGIDICRNLRDSGIQTPILMLTGKTAIKEKKLGLDTGADDYLTKPFNMEELSARVRALLRRPVALKKDTLQVRNIELDTVSGRVTKDGKQIHLLPKEFSLLQFFMRHPNEVFSAESILVRVWPTDSEATTQSLRPYINRLRGKIETPGEAPLICTVHGMGYRFSPD